MNIKTDKMNLLGIYYFADYKLWKEELEEKYMCSFKSLKGLMKNQVNEEVQYLQCNRSGYFRSKQKGKRRSKSSGKFKTFLHNLLIHTNFRNQMQKFRRLPDTL